MGVITTRSVLEGNFPVLLVVCDEDGDWQFLDNLHDAHVDDACLVCLHHVLEHDPSLKAAVSDLAVSRAATRPALGEEWVVEDYADG